MNDTNQMPSMPSINSEDNAGSLPGEQEINNSHNIPSDSESSSEGFTPPVEDDKPEYVDANKSDSHTQVSVNPKDGIKVTALMKGFYNQMRIDPGQKFTVKKFEQLGLWMRCEDPVLDKKRIKFLEEKKQKAREQKANK